MTRNLFRRVEEDAGRTLVVAAAEFLGVPTNICSVKAEATPTDRDRVVSFGSMGLEHSNGHQNGLADRLGGRLKCEESRVVMSRWNLVEKFQAGVQGPFYRMALGIASMMVSLCPRRHRGSLS